MKKNQPSFRSFSISSKAAHVEGKATHVEGTLRNSPFRWIAVEVAGDEGGFC